MYLTEHHLSLVDNMKAFKKMVSGIGVESPLTSGGLDFFDVDHAKLISDYVFTRLAIFNISVNALCFYLVLSTFVLDNTNLHTCICIWNL